MAVDNKHIAALQQTILEMGIDKLEFIRDIQEFQRKMQEVRDANPEIFAMADKVRSILESVKPVVDFVKPLIDAHNAIQGYVNERLKLAKKIKVLSESGWYLPIWFIDSLKIKDLGSVFLNDHERFVNSVTGLFEETLVETIQGRLLDQFPMRARAIESVISAHIRKDYFAVIPLALTLADGFCKDSFFIIDNGKKVPIGFFDLEKPKKAKSTQKLNKAFVVSDTSVFSLLTNQLADDDRDRHLVHERNTSKLSDLNRHAIIHGESIDYGTYINSVKAILLLNFIADLVLMDEVQREDNTETR